MSRIRSQILPMLAGSLGVAILAGCPNAGTQPPLAGTGSAAPAVNGSPAVASASSPGASSAPTASTTPVTPAASASSDGTASATPSAGASAPVPSGAKTILQGDVYNEAAATVDGATVAVKSLDARVPYTANLNVTQGHYVTNDVPVGVQVQITVTKPGWTSRTRVTALQSNVDKRNTINFGGSTNVAEDTNGAPYFISNYPEVTATVPSTETLAGDKMSYKVRMSEPLDDANRRRLEKALRITSTKVTGETGPTTITIDNTSTFLNAAEKVALAWNADNTELTISFNAPLKRRPTEKKTYSLKFFRDSGADTIVDKENNVLGFTAPNTSSFYDKPIKLASLKVVSTDTTAALRWTATHTQGSGFDVTKDDAKPTLKSVSGGRVNVNGTDYIRVEMAFSEAMMTYPDTTQNATVAPAAVFPQSLQGTDATVITPANYTFAISDTPIKSLDMDKSIAGTVNSTTPLTTTTDYMRAASLFRVDNTASHVQISTADPKVVQFDILQSRIPTSARYIRVKVATTVKDPQGNVASEGNKSNTDLSADNVKDGTI